MRKEKLNPCFNFESRGFVLQDYQITLSRPDADPQAQAKDFLARLTRWLRMQGDDWKGNAQAPSIIPSSLGGNAQLSLSCTEETIQRVERQFAGEILRVTPPARHQRGTIYPPKVDPWDVSKW